MNTTAVEADEARPEWQWMRENHLEALRKAAHLAARHEAELLAKLAEVAECYTAVKRARQNAQERYRRAMMSCL